MTTTMDLFSKAMAINPSQYAWSSELGLSKSALSVAKVRGRLSPGIAGAIALKLGEDATKWIAIAALEAEPESAYKKALLSQITFVYFALGQIVVFFQHDDFFRGVVVFPVVVSASKAVKTGRFGLGPTGLYGFATEPSSQNAQLVSALRVTIPNAGSPLFSAALTYP